VKIGEKRQWVGGTGRNIPSFEIFTSPDWRGTDGWIRFNQPLYAYGTLIEGVELEFKKGIIVKAMAKKNEKVLLIDFGLTSDIYKKYYKK
jgi:aminopeptidase